MRLVSVDWCVILFSIFLFFGISLFFKGRKAKSVFSENGKLSWWLASSSLIIIYWNPAFDMINTRLVLEKGYSGLWFTKDILLTIGIAPILFVPMWARLRLTTDNELIRLRYSGKGAKVLQLFRAIYVGLFISSFIISFYLLGIRKILDAIWVISDLQYFVGLLILIPMLVVKNTFQLKIRTDGFVTLLYLITICTGIFFLVEKFGGWLEMKSQLITDERISMLPSKSTTTESFQNWFVFLFVQWWSVRILDDSNPNTQRYFAVGDSWNAFKSIFFAIVIISIMFGLSSFVWDAALLTENQINDSEGLYFKLLYDASPAGIKGLIMIVFIFGFITTIESTLSWGSSFLSIDVYKTYVSRNASTSRTRLIAFLFMGLIFMLSVLIYSFSVHLIGLMEILFSMSAGVGLVFILRWFWWRVNAWSQLSAMLSSLFYTILYESLYLHLNSFSVFVDQLSFSLEMSYYAFKVCILTLLVTSTWLTVTFLTQSDDISHLKKFTFNTKTGGYWPYKTQSFHWRRKLLLIALFVLLGILPICIIWYLKFSSIPISALLTLVWLGVSYLIYTNMKALLRELDT